MTLLFALGQFRENALGLFRLCCAPIFAPRRGTRGFAGKGMPVLLLSARFRAFSGGECQKPLRVLDVVTA